MKYKKKCPVCGKAFESDVRNKKYCGDACAKRGAKKAYRSRKMKHIRSVMSGDEKEIDNIIQTSYKLAQVIAKMFLPKVCSCTEPGHKCNEKLNVHHKDHNCLNNSVTNLCWLCENAHHQIHNEEEDCSVKEELKAYVVIRKQADIRKRNLDKQKKRVAEKEKTNKE